MKRQQKQDVRFLICLMHPNIISPRFSNHSNQVIWIPCTVHCALLRWWYSWSVQQLLRFAMRPRFSIPCQVVWFLIWHKTWALLETYTSPLILFLPHSEDLADFDQFMDTIINGTDLDKSVWCHEYRHYFSKHLKRKKSFSYSSRIRDSGLPRYDIKFLFWPDYFVIGVQSNDCIRRTKYVQLHFE